MRIFSMSGLARGILRLSLPPFFSVTGLLMDRRSPALNATPPVTIERLENTPKPELAVNHAMARFSPITLNNRCR